MFSLSELHDDDDQNGGAAANLDANGNPIDASDTDPVNNDPVNNDNPSADLPANIDDDTLSGVERYLSQFGVVGGMITFDGEDGSEPTSVHFNELSAAEQANVLNQLQQATAGATADLDPKEIDILNVLRQSGKDPETAINELILGRVQQILSLQNSSSEDFASMDDDAVHMRYFKTLNPDMSETELAEEVEKARDSRLFKQNADQYRKMFLAQQESVQQQQTATERAAALEQLEKDRALIAQTVANLQNVAGFNLDNNDKNAVLGKLLEVNQHDDSLFMEEVFSDPSNMFKAAWLYYNAEQAIKSMHDSYQSKISAAYKQGREEVLKGLPSRPVTQTMPPKFTPSTDTTGGQAKIVSLSELHDD
jgi:hypothetical protein